MLKRNLAVKRGSFLAIALALCISWIAVGQSSLAQQPATTQTPPATGAPQQPRTGPSVDDISTTYREPKRDPFLDERLIKRPREGTVGPIEVTPLPWPSYEEREVEWRKKRDDARREGKPEPAPSERYLIEEVQVVGIFKKPDGQGVFLKPKPTTNTMIFASVGQKFYNGSIRKIESRQGVIECEEITRLSNKTIRNDKRVLRFTRTSR
ncbi:MAG: hypothetical protein AB1489_11780 [Acidobacteriota bacterium]